jgi:small subunit ribosomal protein S6
LSKHVYEGLFILDSNRYARDASGVVATIPTTLQQLGGEVLASRLWEERRLAYPIKGHRKGTYWLTYFRLDGDKVTDLTRQFQLNDGVVRSLFLKIDPRIADTMVQHALSGGPAVKPRPEVAPATAPAVAIEEIEGEDLEKPEE